MTVLAVRQQEIEPCVRQAVDHGGPGELDHKRAQHGPAGPNLLAEPLRARVHRYSLNSHCPDHTGLGARDKSRLSHIEIVTKVKTGPAAPHPEHYEQAGARLLDWCRRLAPHLVDELHGYADGSGVPFDDIVYINCGDEARARAALSTGNGCTAFALTADVTGGSILAGQSKDGPGPQYDHYIVLTSRPRGRPAVLQLVYPGMLALFGLSETGMYVGANQIYEKTTFGGMPVMLAKRLLWELDSVDKAAELLASHGLSTANNFLLCDGRGQAACIEVKGPDCGRVDPEDGVLVHTNHYLCDALRGGENEAAIDRYQSHQRRNRLTRLLRERQGRITPSVVFDCYHDHDGWPRSICTHRTCDEYYSTTAVLVAEPRAGRLHICVGNPCRNRPKAYQL